MAHVAAVVSATDLPVSADLENGFGDSPEIVAETIRLAAAAGVVGGSIEDRSRESGHPIYAHDHAVERVRAAAETVRDLPRNVGLTPKTIWLTSQRYQQGGLEGALYERARRGKKHGWRLNSGSASWPGSAVRRPRAGHGGRCAC